MITLLDTRQPLVPGSRTAKARGAYFTDARIARFLVDWALRTPRDTVLDPSCGDGVFLEAAMRRLAHLGASEPGGVTGVEVERQTAVHVRREMSRCFAHPGPRVLNADFFALEPPSIGSYDAVVGNPPFIRYQTFSGDLRQGALACAERAGVRLTKMTNSWAPFLVHSVEFVATGGRLAMVLPAELCHAGYAAPIRRFLAQKFRSLKILSFRQKLFPHLSQDTVLLLADSKGRANEVFGLRDFDSSDDLNGFYPERDRSAKRIDVDALDAGEVRFIEYYLPRTVRELYCELKKHSAVYRLGEIAEVGIGYVTGANDYFHLGEKELDRLGIDRSYVCPTVCRSRAFRGVEFSSNDWQVGLTHGDTAYLLLVNDGRPPPTVKKYLDAGVRRHIHERYKCRSRNPWYRVPHVHAADAFLSYMSGRRSFLVANRAGAVACNSVHVVRTFGLNEASGYGLAVGWHTSLARLSAEIEGHALGGGMLKLEPSEASRVLLPLPTGATVPVRELGELLDGLLRSRQAATAQRTADKVILQGQLGLTANECKLLTDATDQLVARRMGRSGAQSRRNHG